MDTPPPCLLKIPAATLEQLSFCASTSPAAVKEWLDKLPKANLGDYSRQLYQGMQEVNQLQLEPLKRFTLQENLSVAVTNLEPRIARHYLRKPLLLNKQARLAGQLNQVLYIQLAVGYKAVINALKGPKQAHAMQRLMAILGKLLHLSCQLYQQPPQGFWQDCYQLYQQATCLQLEHLKISVPTPKGTIERSINQEYLVLLLLSTARSNQLSASQLDRLWEGLPHWANYCKLQSPPSPFCSFLIDPVQDSAPYYLGQPVMDLNSQQRLLGLDTYPLIVQLEQHLGTVSAQDTTQILLLQHLLKTWHHISERAALRAPGQGQLTSCLGLSGVHYYLSSQIPFDTWLKEHKTQAAFHIDNHPDDLWKRSTVVAHAPDTLGKASHEEHSVFQQIPMTVINQSTSGYCLSAPQQQISHLEVGELLLVSRDKARWLLGCIRWLNQPNQSGPQLGVQLLATQALPAAIRLVHKQHTSAYLRALWLPSQSPVCANNQPLLLAPSITLKQGQKILLWDGQREVRALLGKSQALSSHYNLFQYQVLDMTDTNWLFSDVQRQNVSQDSTGHFDSLWSTL